MRLLITGGGTAGHVYPALTVLDWLCSRLHGDVDVLYLGTEHGMEAEIAHSRGYRYAAIPAGKVRGQGPIGAFAGIATSLGGLAAADRVLREFRPDAILATGGYVSIPGVFAGWRRRIGSVVYLPDVTPGWAVRLLGRFARVVAVTTDRARKALPGSRVVVTGYPVRPGFVPIDRSIARQRLGLDDRFTLTVTGGSSGARRINDAVVDSLSRLVDTAQLLHITGRADYDRIAPLAREGYVVEPYLDSDMPLALAAADLVVSRAGASTLGEYPAVGRPSLLIPGPFSGQIANAAYMAEMGAADLLPNDSAHLLADRVVGLAAESDRLRAMGTAAAALARPHAAADIGRLVMETAEGKR